MKKLAFSFETKVEFSKPVQMHDFVLRCLPKTTPVQTVRARLTLSPSVAFDVQTDSFGNDMAVGRITPEHESFSYCTTGTANVDFSRRAPQAAHPLLLRETPRTAMNGPMREFLADSASAGMRQMVLEGRGSATSSAFICEHLMHMVHQTLAYTPGSTTVHTTAQQAFDQRAGVCQDYSHLLIALIRACNIPARYVSGLTVGEGATHAWVEANLNGMWVGFDPTRNKLVDESYLMLAVGRDWADCPVERGTFQGFADQTQTVFMQVEEVV